MDRRRFLELLAASPALAANWLARLKGGIARRSRSLSAALPVPQAVVRTTKRTGFSLTELLAQKTLPLGILRSHHFYVSLDDIESPGYLARIIQGHNTLVISAYSSEGEGRDSALRRAVLARLRTTSPDDYRSVSGKLTKEGNLQAGRVLVFELRIPSGSRYRFPVDDLVTTIFEEGWSSKQSFDWVETAFGVAENRNASNLIVPCLGRNWRDRHSIDFGAFFETFLKLVPSRKRPLNVYFSLYPHWPSFELESATASLNAAWEESPV